MKAEICSSNKSNIPKVGEVWYHEISSKEIFMKEIFMRISDKVGEKAITICCFSGMFYSVCLSGPRVGDIVQTSKEDKDIELLEFDGCFRKKSGGD